MAGERVSVFPGMEQGEESGVGGQGREEKVCI